MTIFWFRRDLRLEDNTALYHALKNNKDILPIFIFDNLIIEKLEKNDARITFIYSQISLINEQLNSIGKKIAIFKGKPLDIFQELIKNHTIKNVYCNHDYEKYAIERDLSIQLFLKKNNIDFYTYKDQVIFEKSEIVKNDNNPYLVYTPYSNKWKLKLQESKIVLLPSQDFLSKITNHLYNFKTLDELGFQKSTITIKPFILNNQLIENYEDKRNFPALDSTSYLGIYLRFGTISIRHLVLYANQFKEKTFLNELIWREFFMQILYHFPYTATQCFKPDYDAIKWQNNETLFQKWCDGKTGYPLVDAGMRELNSTGFMHNRVRMVVASFLCKDLLIDWKWGEAYFAQKLLDYELSSNVGNWQWAAGCGVDAAPYFRIFNPEEQLKKFDKDKIYCKKWIPELETSYYPKPIVNHAEMKVKCLEMYKKGIQKNIELNE
ncbi:MAG: cryptochrome/photolyase family protein [Flavobacterium sp.]